MKNFSILIISLCLFCGCSSTYEIRTPADATKRLERKNGTIFLRCGTQNEAENFNIVGDSLICTFKEADRAQKIALRDIAMVKRTNRVRAAGQGAAITAGVALTSLVLAIGTKGNQGVDPEGQNSAQSFVMLNIMGGTAAGGVLGAISGAIIGSHEVYNFDPDSLSVHSIGIDQPKK